MDSNTPNAPQTPPPLPWQQPPALPPEAVLRQAPNFGAGSGGVGYGPMDGGSGRPSRTPIWLWVVTLGLLVVLVYFQRPEPEDPVRASEAAKGLGKIRPPRVSEFVLIGKFLIAVQDLMKAQGGSGGLGSGTQNPAAELVQVSDQFAGWVGQNRFAPVSASNPPEPLKKGHEPEAAADRLRATIVAGEVLKGDELEWRVKDVEETLAPDSPLVEDAKVVRVLYGLPDAGGAAESGHDSTSVSAAMPPQGADAAKTLTDAQRDGFKARHGWFAELALSRGDTTSTLRQAAAGQGMALLVVFIVLGVVILFAFFAGLALLIVFLVKGMGGSWQWRMRRPQIEQEWPRETGVPDHVQRSVTLATPGSVWLETVAVFFASFLGIKLIGAAMHKAGVSDDVLIGYSLAAQWAIALSIFWPLVRGMSWARWKSDIGWAAPRGVAREVGAGVLGYLAGIPVYFGMAVVVVIITIILNAITGGETRPPSNRILDLVEGGSVIELIVIYLLATVWAPVVEESIFRGCLFRHLRRRTGVVLAGLGSALVFAALHGYVLQGLIMVGTLGFWFALMREWRGSIVPSAVAHAIHNGFVMAIMMIVLSMAGA